MYKTAFLGCGGRARAHASAYRFVKGGKIAAICDMNTETKLLIYLLNRPMD